METPNPAFHGHKPPDPNVSMAVEAVTAMAEPAVTAEEMMSTGETAVQEMDSMGIDMRGGMNDLHCGHAETAEIGKTTSYEVPGDEATMPAGSMMAGASRRSIGMRHSKRKAGKEIQDVVGGPIRPKAGLHIVTPISKKPVTRSVSGSLARNRIDLNAVEAFANPHTKIKFDLVDNDQFSALVTGGRTGKTAHSESLTGMDDVGGLPMHGATAGKSTKGLNTGGQATAPACPQSPENPVNLAAKRLPEAVTTNVPENVEMVDHGTATTDVGQKPKGSAQGSGREAHAVAGLTDIATGPRITRSATAQAHGQSNPLGCSPGTAPHLQRHHETKAGPHSPSGLSALGLPILYAQCRKCGPCTEYGGCPDCFGCKSCIA